MQPAMFMPFAITTGILVAATAAGETEPDLAAAREAVRAADLAMAAAVAGGDAEGFRSWIGAEAAFLGGTSVLNGPDEVAAAWARFLDPEDEMSLSWEPTEVTVAASGELAFSIGDFVLRYPGAGGEIGTQSGEYLSVWSRGEDGRWRAVADGTLTSRDPGPVELSWAELRRLRPELAAGGPLAIERRHRRLAVATSGDLAYSLGVRTVRAGGGEGEAVWQGAVLTVWRREGDGPWRAVAEAAAPLRPAGGG